MEGCVPKKTLTKRTRRELVTPAPSTRVTRSQTKANQSVEQAEMSDSEPPKKRVKSKRTKATAPWTPNASLSKRVATLAVIDASDAKEEPPKVLTKLETPDPSDDEMDYLPEVPQVIQPWQSPFGATARSNHRGNRGVQTAAAAEARRVQDQLEERERLHAKFVKKRKATIKPVAYGWYADICDEKGEKVRTIGFGPAKSRELELALRDTEDSTQFDYRCKLSTTASGASPLPPGYTAMYRRVLTIAGSKVVLPKGWAPLQKCTCELFKLDLETSEEAKEIAARFYETMPNAKITCIQRIQNLLTYQKYHAECLKIAADCEVLGGINCGDHCEDGCEECQVKRPAEVEDIERLAFHGTRTLLPQIIYSSQEGFDARLASDQSLWGPGAYFADDASYSDKFSCRYRDGIKRMLVAKVAVGSGFDYGTLCNPTLDQPPPDIMNHGRHHSINGITKDARVHCVYNSNQACPVALLTYTTGVPPAAPV